MENMDLKIFAKTCEPEVYSQVYRLMNLHVFREAKVRIMPDTHAGVGTENIISSTPKARYCQNCGLIQHGTSPKASQRLNLTENG